MSNGSESLNNKKNQSIKFALKDSSGIDPKSIEVFIDMKEDDFSLDEKSNILSIDIGSLKGVSHTLRIICANKNGNHSLPFNKTLTIRNRQIEVN